MTPSQPLPRQNVSKSQGASPDPSDPSSAAASTSGPLRLDLERSGPACPLLDVVSLAGSGLLSSFKDAESDWHRTESVLHQILNAIADPVFVKDSQGRWCFLNEAYCTLVGHSYTVLLGQSELAIFSAAEAEPFLQADRQVMSTGEAYEHEAAITDAQGHQHVVLSKTARFLAAGGEPMLVGTIRDITERVVAEQKLQRQAERERLLGAIAPHLLQALNPEQLRQTTVNEIRRFLEVDRVLFYSFDPDSTHSTAVTAEAEACALGISSVAHLPPDQIGLPTAALLPQQRSQVQAIANIAAAALPADQAAQLSQHQIQACLVVPITQGETLYGLVCAQHCRSARSWTDWEIEALKEVVSQISSAIKQANLIQQVRQLNAALERQNAVLERQVEQRTGQLSTALEFEATLKRITDRVRDSLDQKQIMLTAVKELTEALGVKGSNTALYDLEQGTSTIYYEYNRSLPSYQGRVAQMEAFPEVYHQLLEGQYFQFCSKEPNPVRGHVAMLACPILDDRGVLGDLWLIKNKDSGFNELEIRLVQQVANQCAIAIRQARLYQAAQTQVEELERLNRLKDDFLSTVSHELRTPVTSMRVALQLLGVTLNQEFDLSSELQKPKLEQNRLARYYQILQEECEREISLINDLLDLQRLDVGNHPVHPEAVALAAWLPGLVNGFVARAKSRQQTLNLELQPELPMLNTDLASLERILAELLNNACKYTPPGETIYLEVLPAADPAFPEVHFRLTNTGTEIPAAELPRIFDKFYRVPSADPWKQGGTGLGLALVQKLVQYLGGEIVVESHSQKTAFTVKLPTEFVVAI
ncbi:MAG TPA: GAF domain-containing protein [Trichocoleus sp.]